MAAVERDPVSDRSSNDLAAAKNGVRRLAERVDAAVVALDQVAGGVKRDGARVGVRGAAVVGGDVRGGGAGDRCALAAQTQPGIAAEQVPDEGRSGLQVPADVDKVCVGRVSPD